MIETIFSPETLEEALGLLADKGDSARVLAGGTDLMVRERRGMLPASIDTLVSVHKIPDLRGVRRDGDELVVGAATTAADLTTDPVIAEYAPILAEVADRVASQQIRNVATIGGNLANASPAGDLISPLLLLDARLGLASNRGRWQVAVDEFFTGPGDTVLRSDELLAEVRFPVPLPGRVFRFAKAGTRPSMECSVVTVGLAFTPAEGNLTDLRVALGAVAPTPLRGWATEAMLEDQPLTPEVIERAARAAEDEASPISDIRGGEDYRRHLVGVYLRRLLNA